MDFNSLIFPNPKCRFSASDFENEILWIPVFEKQKQKHLQPGQRILSFLLCTSSVQHESKHENRIDNRIDYFNSTSFGQSNKNNTNQMEENFSTSYESKQKSFQMQNSTNSVKIRSQSQSTPNNQGYTTQNLSDESANNQNLQQKIQILKHIPCLYFQANTQNSPYILIFYHGNGEDISQTYEFLTNIRNNLEINVLAIEYPGYGIYKGKASAHEIEKDSLLVYEFLKNVGFEAKNIFVFGRSIGSGPATYLASRKTIGSLILMSPFTSIKAAVKDMAGFKLHNLLKERFNNLKLMKYVTCPTFMVHGMKDTLIPYKHSQSLYNECRAPCKLYLPKEMTHLQFDYYEDIIKPLKKFFQKCGINLENKNQNSIQIPQKFFQNPLKKTNKEAYNQKKNSEQLQASKALPNQNGNLYLFPQPI